jgi:TolA-binding protein
MANARRTSFDLIRKQPSSPLVPYAYFAFAELFFNEAQTDPSKWMMAQEAYTQVLKYPHTPIAPEAVYRLMLVFKGMGDDARAEEMKQRILRDYPTSAAASRVTSS